MSKKYRALPDGADQGMDVEVKRIRFEDLKRYWIEFDNFKKTGLDDSRGRTHSGTV